MRLDDLHIDDKHALLNLACRNTRLWADIPKDDIIIRCLKTGSDQDRCSTMAEAVNTIVKLSR